MQKMIMEIFDKVNVEIPDLTNMEKDLANQAEAILENLQTQVPQEYYDEILQ